MTQFSFSTYSGGTPQSTHVTQLMKSLHSCNKSKMTPGLSLYCFIGFVTIIICCLAVPFMALSIDQDANNMVVNLDGASALSLFGYRGFGLKHILLITWFPFLGPRGPLRTPSSVRPFVRSFVRSPSPKI